jgi:Ca2+:H+ antiporter
MQHELTEKVGSSIQIALFVIPVIQLLAWTIGKPMT